MLGQNGEIPLPVGWDFSHDFDGKVYFIDHNTKKTTWVDPRDRYMKPQTFSDCVGNELPLGWEEGYDPQIGVYYIDHINEVTQVEDPRLQWRSVQEDMLRDYLSTVQEDLNAKKEICDIKSQRLSIAQDEYKHLNNTLTNLATSYTSLCSASSNSSTKYDPDLLKADVSLAKSRVSRLKQELEQVRCEVKDKEQGFEKLALVKEKLATQHEVYNISQAQAIYNELRNIQKSLICGEKEKAQLLQSLASLRDDLTKQQHNEAAPDMSILHKFDTASQTDLSGEIAPIGARLAEMAKIRLQYDDSRKKVHVIQQQIADLEDSVNPGQTESDKDRLLLIQEKEQLLRELRSINIKGRTESDVLAIRSEIAKLEQDMNVAMEMSNRAIADRLKVHEQKNTLIQDLKDLLRQTTYLESQLRSLSASTLSMSSSSSLGSLSTSSSKGSLSSVSFSDIYGMPQYTVDTGLCDLHKRVEKLLQGSKMNALEDPSNSDINSYASPPMLPLESGHPPSYDQLYQPSKHSDILSEKLNDMRINCEDKRQLRLNLADIDESSFPAPPLSPIHEHNTDLIQGTDQQSGTQLSVSAAVSNESVAGDSGVFEASNKRSEEQNIRLSRMNLETAQVQVKLRYSSADGLLHVGLERSRNLAALCIPVGHQVCIKAVLLPSIPDSNLGGSTRFSTDIDNPTFGETLRLLVPTNKLCTKTLQVNVWSMGENKEEECLGCAQVSLGDFTPDTSSTKWYNVLSFRFMQPETEPSQVNLNQQSLFMKDSASCLHHSSGVINSKEESSDESTIISSQTSTLTRNQAVPILYDCPPQEEESEDSDDDNDELSCQCEELCLCDTQETEEKSVEICDKETNTECVFLPERAPRCKPNCRERSALIKRSQTFSPSAVVCKSQYNCRLNRSDSDSSMPLYRRGASFRRNAVERRSLRWKKGSGLPVNLNASQRSSGSHACSSNKYHLNEPRTSIDLELDLQASQTKLVSLKDDLAKLRELKQRLELVKKNDSVTVSKWCAENDLILQIISGVNKEGNPLGAEEKRIHKLLKKTSREIYKLRKNRHQQPNVISFKEKISFFTKTHSSLSSALKLNSDDGDDENEETSKHAECKKSLSNQKSSKTSQNQNKDAIKATLVKPPVQRQNIQQIISSEENLGVEV